MLTAIAQGNNWFCDSRGKANFILRAKRINVYSDSIELVWFDHADVTDPMYALYLAVLNIDLAASGVATVSGNLCTRPRTIVAQTNMPFVASHPIVTVSRPAVTPGR